MLSNNQMYLCSAEETTYDPNYRYKIDAPAYEIKKKKGATITCFTNSVKFAAMAEIDHSLLIQLIGTELSCSSSIDPDLKCGLFKGLFEPTQLTKIIETVIQGFWLCQSCDKPEVILYLKKNQLRQSCKACGEKHYVKTELELSSSSMYDLVAKSIKKKKG